MTRYVEVIRAAGGDVFLSTRAEHLAIDGDRVVGLEAVGEDGVTHHVSADAVLLATGGWMNNPELVDEFLPEYKDYYVNALITNTGDGLYMAKEAGGEWVGMDLGITSTNKAYHSKNNTIFFSTDIPIVLVNAHGERFVDESSSYKKYLRQCKDPKHGGASLLHLRRGRLGARPRFRHLRPELLLAYRAQGHRRVRERRGPGRETRHARAARDAREEQRRGERRG